MINECIEIQKLFLTLRCLDSLLFKIDMREEMKKNMNMCIYTYVFKTINSVFKILTP